jgi:hypothetical protein
MYNKKTKSEFFIKKEAKDENEHPVAQLKKNILWFKRRYSTIL